jgi:hypothetical protein
MTPFQKLTMIPSEPMKNAALILQNWLTGTFNIS